MPGEPTMWGWKAQSNLWGGRSEEGEPMAMAKDSIIHAHLRKPALTPKGRAQRALGW